MPKPFTATSGRVYQIPDRSTDPVLIEDWFEGILASVDAHLTAVAESAGEDPFFLMGA